MKFQIKDKHMIRNEIAEVGANFPLFRMEKEEDGYIVCKEQQPKFVELSTMSPTVELAYVYEIWNYASDYSGLSYAIIIKPIGYEMKKNELYYAEEYSEVSS